MNPNRSDLPPGHRSSAVDLDFPEDASASAADRAVDAELSRVLPLHLQSIDLPASTIDVSAIARRNRRPRSTDLRRSAVALSALAAAAAIAVVSVMLGRGLLPGQMRPVDAPPAGASQSQQVAPWGESTTQFLTAEPLREGAVFITRPPSPDSDGAPPQAAARVYGTLAVLSGGCLGIAPGTTVVWPSGTVALADGSGVRLSDGQILRVGDVLDGGGGYANIQFTGAARSCPGQDVAYLNDPPRP